jgi:hypothetical protein
MEGNAVVGDCGHHLEGKTGLFLAEWDVAIEIGDFTAP